jgi:ABC-type uncharacterized transport system substrate-binding protein
LRRQISTIPIVFVLVTDPVGQGFVESLARPGANITGFTDYDPPMAGKWLRMLTQIIPPVAARHRLPAVYPFRYFATEGGVMSYGPDQIEQWRGAATYVDRILRGEKPGDLPVQAPTKFELVINLKTAKALGLNVPPGLLNAADEVIE